MTTSQLFKIGFWTTLYFGMNAVWLHMSGSYTCILRGLYRAMCDSMPHNVVFVICLDLLSKALLKVWDLFPDAVRRRLLYISVLMILQCVMFELLYTCSQSVAVPQVDCLGIVESWQRWVCTVWEYGWMQSSSVTAHPADSVCQAVSTEILTECLMLCCCSCSGCCSCCCVCTEACDSAGGGSDPDSALYRVACLLLACSRHWRHTSRCVSVERQRSVTVFMVSFSLVAPSLAVLGVSRELL